MISLRHAASPLLVSVIAGCAGAQAASDPVAMSAVSAAAPTLIVMITVDQLRPDYFNRWGKQLTGGLARLYQHGAFYGNAYQDHAITETAPGHSVILAGRYPRSTGIFANIYGVNTDSAPLIGSRGIGASPFRFKGTTLIDWLVAKDSRTRVLSVSRKDRGAILPIGKSKQPVFWFSPEGSFTTSRYYADTLPAWVNAFNARGMPRRAAGRAWELLLPASEYAEVDSVPWENGHTRDIVFPHFGPADSATAAMAYGNFPWMDELTLDFALEGMRVMNLGRGPQTDILNISLSTLDAVGHRYGPDSREVHDMLLRIDRYLGAFFQALYAERDSATIVIALTSDHGVNPYPEIVSRHDRNRGAGRVAIMDVVAVAMEALSTSRVDTSALRWAEGMLFVDRSALESAKLQPDVVAGRMAAAIAKIPGVGRADTWKTLMRADTVHEAVPRRWLHMVPPTYPVDVFVSLRPFWDWEGGPPIANHGSPNDYDARVPVIFYGPWIKAGQHPEMVRVVDIAPTLAAVAGVRPSEALDGKVLSGALLRPAPGKVR